ncbi:uncharacterized protein SCHCODRAFT_02729179 [Schizophyllum commune H4-8]|nr:uncharacterized protein SCHCODRAFT_02729179 [Schizophyllum commune H4-8]KAI5893065.1 hypothetical protein SCHCODRAFT_02729179 [Schizophyllum commune H4-8]
MAPHFEGTTPMYCDNLDLLRYPPLPRGWEVFYHPRNGDVYYWNRDERVITEDDICDASVLTGVLRAKGKAMRELQRRGLHELFCTDQGKLKGSWDLIIGDGGPLSLVGWRLEELYEFVEDEERYIEHSSERVFWLRIAEFPCHHSNLLRRTEQQMMHIRHRHPRLMNALLKRPGNMELYKEYRVFRDEALARTPSRYCDDLPAVVWRLACLLSEAHEMADARNISLERRSSRASSS